MIKIAFIDVDGTLLKFGEKEPTKNTVYALNKLKESGVILCMATGRCYPSIPSFQGLDFDVYLTFNGSYVRNKHEVIRSKPISREDTRLIISNLKRMNRAIAIGNEEFLVASGTEPDLQDYFELGNVKMTIADNFDELSKRDIHQIMCASNMEDFDEILEGTKDSKIAVSWDRAVDVIPANGGKGAAVEDVLRHYDIDKSEAIAFGDSMNDIEMFASVGLGVAMGNASDEVKGYAKDVCASVYEDGIYKYCIDNGYIVG